MENNFNFKFKINWVNGGSGKIMVTVESKKQMKKDEMADYKKFLERTLHMIISQIGKDRMLPFNVETTVADATEKKNYHYGDETINVTVTGDNPACHKILKKRIEAAFGAYRFSNDICSILDDAFNTVKDAGRGFVIIIERLVQDE